MSGSLFFSTFSDFFKKKMYIKAILCNFSMRMLKYFFLNVEFLVCPQKVEKNTLKSCSEFLKSNGYFTMLNNWKCKLAFTPAYYAFLTSYSNSHSMTSRRHKFFKITSILFFSFFLFLPKNRLHSIPKQIPSQRKWNTFNATRPLVHCVR